MSSCSFLAILIIVLSLNQECFSRGPIIINFGPGSKDMFVSEEGCKGDEFTVEEYKKDPDITSPHSSNGYFLKICNSGCMATRSLPLEPDSQIKMYYRIIDPGVELQIIVGDNVYKPNLEFEGWGTFKEELGEVPDNAQVKLLSTFVGGFPLVAIDRFEITPHASTTNETITDEIISLKLTTFPIETASPDVTTSVQEMTSPEETISQEGITSSEFRNFMEETFSPEEKISPEETTSSEATSFLEVNAFTEDTTSPEVTNFPEVKTSLGETTSPEGTTPPEWITSTELRNSLEEAFSPEGITSLKFRNSLEEIISQEETIFPEEKYLEVTRTAENPEYRLGHAMDSIAIRESDTGNNVQSLSNDIDHFRARLIQKAENITVNKRMERIDEANMNFWKPVSLTAISIAILLILILFSLSMFLLNTECF